MRSNMLWVEDKNNKLNLHKDVPKTLQGLRLDVLQTAEAGCLPGWTTFFQPYDKNIVANNDFFNIIGHK